ncbi:hypothetical protein TcWFU_002801 [Taenia crassiceps]|uniref:Uncharacterized protein n=1 Tax=Taenia crassiceps TaxID=6207 RepID=A0ABR4QPL3_9CEST
MGEKEWGGSNQLYCQRLVTPLCRKLSQPDTRSSPNVMVSANALNISFPQVKYAQASLEFGVSQAVSPSTLQKTRLNHIRQVQLTIDEAIRRNAPIPFPPTHLSTPLKLKLHSATTSAEARGISFGI